MTPYIFFMRVLPAIICICIVIAVVIGCVRWYLSSKLARQRREIREARDYIAALQGYHSKAVRIFAQLDAGTPPTSFDTYHEMSQKIEKKDYL